MLTYETKPVHTKFIEWLDDTLITAKDAMIEHLTVPLTSDQLFDAVVPAGQRELLRAASKLMVPMYSQTYQAKIFNNLMDKYPTGKHHIPVILLFRYSEPNHFLLPNALKPLSEFTLLNEYLLPAFHVAREFAMLRYTIKELIKITDNRDMLAALFPWLPDLVTNSGWVPYKEHKELYDPEDFNRQWHKFYYEQLSVKSVVERTAIDRSFAGALKRGRDKPLMHTEVMQTINLGTKLFTQYRLLKSQELAGHKRAPYSYIIPILSDDLVPLSLINALKETNLLYQHEREQRNKKRFASMTGGKR
jgi:hypothetical protein